MGARLEAKRGIPEGFPPGRRTPRGKQVRWYLVHAPEGREQALCDRVRKVVPSGLLADAFVLRKERWFKRGGEWSLQPVPLYKEYFFVATNDVVALDRELAGLSFPARIAGSAEHAYQPLSPEAQEWFESAMDEDHVLRNSTASIVDGRLLVQAGPLAGQEARVTRIDRHKRDCRVTVCEGRGGTFAQIMPLEVPFKS